LEQAYEHLEKSRDQLKARMVAWVRWLLLALFGAAVIATFVGMVFGQNAVPAGVVAFLALPSAILDVRDRITGHSTVSRWLRRRAEPVERAIHRRQLQRLFRIYGQYESARIVQLGRSDPDAVEWFSPDLQIYRRRRRRLTYAAAIAVGLVGTSVWLLLPTAGERSVRGTFRLGASLQVKIEKLSCRHGDERIGQPDTCTVDVEFTNVGHVRSRVGPDFFGSITPSATMFYGRDYATSLRVGEDYYDYDSGLSRFAHADLPQGSTTTAALVYDVVYANVVGDGRAAPNLLFATNLSGTVMRVTLRPAQPG
jgi:hypothetical protein